MAKDHQHRSHRKPGGYHPYRNTPKGTSPGHTEPSTGTEPQGPHTTQHSLKQKIGGDWRWDSEKHRFSAEFDPKIASAISNYLGTTCHTTCTSESIPITNKTRLSLTTEQSVTALRHFPRNEPQLLSTFERMIALSKGHHRG